ncbi:oxidoreductase [Streptomyces griseocarneus]|nr:oxidoreductase [Streptomyces griseocarneus]
MPSVDRRTALGLLARGGLAALGTAALGGARGHASAATRTDFTALVIGSGFGGSVAALRLGRAGVDTLVLERGREWPVAPEKPIFGSVDHVTDTMYWFREATADTLSAVPSTALRPAPGVLEVAEEPHLNILCGAGVGGGSLVYTCVTIAPRRRYFEQLYPAGLSYREFEERWFPRAYAMLGARPMPERIYTSAPFAHSRLWNRELANARMATFPLASTFDWDVVRAELDGRARPSATVGHSDFGCGNGAKHSLTRGYLPAALATGHVQLRPLHEVRSLHRLRDGRYGVEVRRLGPAGEDLGTAEFTCRMLFVAAGTLNTNRLLVAARDRGALPGLPAELGTGFGTNGDETSTRTQPPGFTGGPQGAPSASAAFLPTGFAQPLLVENWYLAGRHARPETVTLTITVDTDNRGTFRYDRATGRVRLADWTPEKSAPAARATQEYGARVVEANPGTRIVSPYNARPFTAHPVGGCGLGRVTDLEGRVRGCPGLYVLDGSLLPGNVGGANPSLTITAVAERAMAHIIGNGG